MREKRRDVRGALVLLASVFFRLKPNEVRRDDSMDGRGASASIGAFMLVGGYDFSGRWFDCSVDGRPPKMEPDFPKMRSPMVLARL